MDGTEVEILTQTGYKYITYNENNEPIFVTYKYEVDFEKHTISN